MTEQSLIGSKEERRHRIGGSDFGSVLDVNPYKSRFELILNKAGVLYDVFTGNEFTKRGEELEDTMLKVYQQYKGEISFDIDNDEELDNHLLVEEIKYMPNDDVMDVLYTMLASSITLYSMFL